MSRGGRAWLLAATLGIALCATPRPPGVRAGPARVLHLVFGAGPSPITPDAAGRILQRAFGGYAQAPTSLGPAPAAMTWDALESALDEPAATKLAAAVAAPRGRADEERLAALIDSLEERARDAGEDWLVTLVTPAGTEARADSFADTDPSKTDETAWLLAGCAGPHVAGRLAPGSLRGVLSPSSLATWHASHLDGASAPGAWPSWVAAPPELGRELIVGGDAAAPLAAGAVPPGWVLASGAVRRARGVDGRWYYCADDRRTLVLRQRVPLPSATGTRVLRVEAELGAGDAVVELRFGHTGVRLGPGEGRRSVALDPEVRNVDVTVTLAPGSTDPGSEAPLARDGGPTRRLDGVADDLPGRLEASRAGLARVSLEIATE